MIYLEKVVLIDKVTVNLIKKSQSE